MMQNEHVVKFNAGVDNVVDKANTTIGTGIDKGAILAASATKLAVKATTKGVGLLTKLVGDITIIAGDSIIGASGKVIETISEKAGAVKAGKALFEAQKAVQANPAPAPASATIVS